MCVYATEKPESLYGEGVFVGAVHPPSSDCSVVGMRFRRGFSALLWYQYSAPHEIKTPALFSLFPLKIKHGKGASAYMYVDFPLSLST